MNSVVVSLQMNLFTEKQVGLKLVPAALLTHGWQQQNLPEMSTWTLSKCHISVYEIVTILLRAPATLLVFLLPI